MELLSIPVIIAGFIIHWLVQGFRAFGLTYAYLQRRYPDDSTDDLWSDFIICLRAIPAGWFGLANAVLYLKNKDAWLADKNRPMYGYKFLPRHEYRKHEHST